MCEPKMQLPLTRDGRTLLRTTLLDFGSAVDRFISDPDAEQASENVKKYTRAVERAASDAGPRKDRGDVLRQELAAVALI